MTAIEKVFYDLYLYTWLSHQTDGHRIAIRAPGNWFASGCSILWSHKHKLWLFCRFLKKIIPLGKLHWESFAYYVVHLTSAMIHLTTKEKWLKNQVRTHDDLLYVTALIYNGNSGANCDLKSTTTCIWVERILKFVYKKHSLSGNINF